MYLKVNKSPRLAVAVKVGAVSAANSYAAFQVIVLPPVPSWIISNETNWPAIGVVPLGADKVLFPANVTLATGESITFQVIVAPSVNVSSTYATAPETVVKLLASAVNTFYAAVVPSVARS